MNLTVKQYEQLNNQQRKELVRAIIKCCPDLSFHSFVAGCRYHFPRFCWPRMNMHFIYIPGGSFKMGLSEAEEKAARAIGDMVSMNVAEMRPVTEVTVKNFLVAELPFLVGHMNSLYYWLPRGYRSFWGCYLHQPYYAWFKTVRDIMAFLQLRIPTEAEREYYCRANTRTLFNFGDRLLPDQEMKKWFNDDFSEMKEIRRNDFGLCGLLKPEWTSDLFRYDYSPDSKVATRTRALRGGGDNFFPWRDKEHDWIWCASAIRVPSTYLVNETATFRLVMDL